MSTTRALRLGLLITLPRLVAPGSHFVRTVILSHILAPRELGVAIALTVVLSTAELVTDFGLDRYLVSRDRSNDSEALAAAHALQLCRGFGLAVLILLFAPTVASLLAAPGEATLFRWCALILIVRDASHLEIRQAQRDLNYQRESAGSLIARAAAVLTVYPAALAFVDARAMVASLVVDAVVYTTMSHLLARRPYRAIPHDRRIWRGALAYSLPLTLNGIGLAASSQLDRALISHWLGIAALALYSLALNLAVVPAAIVIGVLNLVSVSLLAQARTDENERKIRYGVIAWGHAVMALAYAIAVSAMLQMLAPWVFGQAYRVDGWVVILISWILAIRIVRGAPTALLLARSRTRQLMTANLLSVTGLLLAFVLLPLQPRMETMLACVLIGDSLSLAFMLRLVRSVGYSRRSSADRQVRYAAALAAISPPVLQIAAGTEAAWRLGIGGAALFAVAVYLVLGMRRYLTKAAPAVAFEPQGF